MIDAVVHALVQPSAQIAASGPMRLQDAGPAYYVASREVASSIQAEYSWDRRVLRLHLHYQDEASPSSEVLEVPMRHRDIEGLSLRLRIDESKRRVHSVEIEGLDIERIKAAQLNEAIRGARDRYLASKTELPVITQLAIWSTAEVLAQLMEDFYVTLEQQVASRKQQHPPASG